MESDGSDKLLFRMQHIIPRGLHHDKPNVATPNLIAEEITIPLTWGNLAGKVWGPANGKPVFACHGWLDNCATFDALVPLLPQDLRIVAIDIPGHGLSDHFPCDISYNLYDCLVAVERISQELGWSKFSFIGHSLGGCMAMLYASVFPEKVEKLVLLDIVRLATTKPDTMGRRLRKTTGKLLKYERAIKAGPEKPISYDAAVEKSITGSFGSLDKKACDILFTRGLKKVDGGYVFRRDRRLLAAPLNFAPKEDNLVLAKQVTAEVLIIKFSDGPDFESPEDCQEHVEALKTSCKSVRFVEVPGRHHVHLTHPERVASLISDFFSK